MASIPSWLYTFIGGRVDMIGKQMQQNRQHKLNWEKANELLEMLRLSFSPEQRRQFGDWEDCMELQEAREKEEMYVRGLLDGFQMQVALMELLDQEVGEDCGRD